MSSDSIAFMHAVWRTVSRPVHNDNTPYLGQHMENQRYVLFLSKHMRRIKKSKFENVQIRVRSTQITQHITTAP
jgi:hypothetical protein